MAELPGGAQGRVSVRARRWPRAGVTSCTPKTAPAAGCLQLQQIAMLQGASKSWVLLHFPQGLCGGVLLPPAPLCSGCAPPAVPVPSALRACVQAWLGCVRGGNGANPDVASMNGREKAFQGVQPCTLLCGGLAGWPQNPERCVQGGGCCHPFPPLLHRSCVHRGISLPPV